MTVEVVNLDKMMLSKTSEYQEGYVPHRILNDLSIGSNQINDLTSGVKSILGAYSNNIIDLSKVLSETYVEFSTGKILPSANFNVCGFYEVRPLTQYQTSSNYFQQFCFYDAEYKYISGMAKVDTSSFTFTTPANAKYIRLTVDKGLENSLVVAEKSLFPKEYSRMVYVLKTYLLKRNNFQNYILL
ncbi:hypothetical protein IDM30_15480 [Acinetobacter seifertii]|nr:hypothetical protein [Acinetobacter seifertii]